VEGSWEHNNEKSDLITKNLFPFQLSHIYICDNCLTSILSLLGVLANL